jgi:pyruvate/2-oxoglutarate dehydrogenase complex dihydrolipoamide dehydrogenase (E3) component
LHKRIDALVRRVTILHQGTQLLDKADADVASEIVRIFTAEGEHQVTAAMDQLAAGIEEEIRRAEAARLEAANQTAGRPN